jgi:flavin reductase (DIM6/NTAB) family NADH-FMN oxidoreductase RutF
MMMIRKKPWNRVDQPVYSISSAAEGSANMNICTYATPVTLHPKNYVVAIYKNTRTLELVQRNPKFILQFLEKSQYRWVNLLGKKSGKETDKISLIRDEIFFLGPYPILSRALAYVILEVSHWIDAGDHFCAFCRVNNYKNLNNGTPLTTHFLRKKKIIS